MAYNIIVVLGPTASGKTELAVNIAKNIGAEIISADSRQIYRNMNIGTGKDIQKYNDVGITHHLIDIVNPEDDFSVFDYQQKFFLAYKEIVGRNKKVILSGGTGMYLSLIHI